jgi:hypothetical protein
MAFLICAGCGGGGGSPGAPPADFTLAVTPLTLSTTVGTISPPAVITVTGQNGFTGKVSVAASGLPPGATSLPTTPLLMTVPSSQQIVFFIPPTAQTGSLSILVSGSAGNRDHSAQLTLKVTPVSGTATLQPATGQVAAGTIEIQGLSVGTFSPNYWQNNTLNWVPDVRVPMLAPLTSGPCQNIYAPWAVEQSSGWRMFYGGWDGADTCNDNVYSVTTPDFLSFYNRILVIGYGDFRDVNNENVTQLSDGSMHMISTALNDSITNGDKPAYFSSPDGVTWNGTPEPYSAQLSDVVSIPNDPNYPVYDFNGGNVLLWDNNSWILYYSSGSIGEVYRATSSSPPVFQKTGVALNTVNYFDDVKKFSAGGKSWYVAAIYSEVPTAPLFTFSLSNDGVTFSPEQSLFAGASASDKFLLTPSFVTKGSSILGVLYGASPTSPLAATNQIFARWLQRSLIITDPSGVQHLAEGSYGPDRQWFQAPGSGTLEGTMVVYAEDGVTVLGSSYVTLEAGKAYTLLLQ